MWEYIGAFGISSVDDGQSLQNLISARPGGVIRVSHPDAIQFLPRPVATPDCQGCGAPSSRYQPVCEYCRRPR